MIRLVMTDIDGVWTDGGMYYSDNGFEMKKFNTSDSAGVLFLKELNIPIYIITGEVSDCVQLRARKLGISGVFMGIKNKLDCGKKICNENNIDLSEAAYIGDDIYDIPLLKEVGLSACPSNSPSYVKQIVNIVLTRKGGDGAFREFVEECILAKQNIHSLVESLINQF